MIFKFEFSLNLEANEAQHLSSQEEPGIVNGMTQWRASSHEGYRALHTMAWLIHDHATKTMPGVAAPPPPVPLQDLVADASILVAAVMEELAAPVEGGAAGE